MRECECGNEVEYDGYNSMEIEEGYLLIRGDAVCNACGKSYKYTDTHEVVFNRPLEVELEEK